MQRNPIKEKKGRVWEKNEVVDGRWWENRKRREGEKIEREESFKNIRENKCCNWESQTSDSLANIEVITNKNKVSNTVNEYLFMYLWQEHGHFVLSSVVVRHSECGKKW